MHSLKIRSSWGSRQAALFSFTCLAIGVIIAILVGRFGSFKDFEPAGLATASRTLNQLSAVLATCIALIIPLTANLYTPKLVKLYVTHPLIVCGLAIHFIGMMLALSVNLFPSHSVFHLVAVRAIALIYLTVLVGALPYLFAISQFLRPTFFMPMLTRKAVSSLEDLNKGKHSVQNLHDLFETIDVVTNLALTGMTRSDRQLVLLTLQSLHSLLTEIIGSGERNWRNLQPRFVPGLAQEGQEFLIRERVWPEAYVVAQTLKVMEGANNRQHEILAEVAGQMVETARLASVFRRDTVVELHIMAFNTLMREAIEAKDLRRFQNLSYHYRLLIEAFHETPARMHEAAQHLLHYGKFAIRQDLFFGMETVIYDMGELVLSLGRYDEERAVELVQAWAGPLWQDAIDRGSQMKKVGWRTLVRVYWEAKAYGLEELASALYWRYLSDEAIHREQLEIFLEENRELHFEFNDRLMRFAHLSPGAVAKAQEFLESW